MSWCSWMLRSLAQATSGFLLAVRMQIKNATEGIQFPWISSESLLLVWKRLSVSLIIFKNQSNSYHFIQGQEALLSKKNSQNLPLEAISLLAFIHIAQSTLDDILYCKPLGHCIIYFIAFNFLVALQLLEGLPVLLVQFREGGSEDNGHETWGVVEEVVRRWCRE